MAKEKTNRQTPGVVFQPKTCLGMKRGIDKMVDAIRPTLGPVPRMVLVEKESKVGKPEMLDDGATIARRIIQLPDREEDIGAMYLRQILWKLHETVGDGTATAAVLFHAIYSEGLRYIAAGGNPMLLREAIEEAAQTILDELHQGIIHISGKEKLARLAESICYDNKLAKMLGEIFDIIGEYGLLDIRIGSRRELEREYVEGMYWESSLLSREMIDQPLKGIVKLEDAAILMTDLEIKEMQELLPVLEDAVQAGVKSLLITASTISEKAMALLLSPANREKIHVVAVKAPGISADANREGLEELALLTGGRIFFKATESSLQEFHKSDLGFARRVWADSTHFGISGGKGDPRQLRQYIARMRTALDKAKDIQARKKLQERIGKLLGGSAVLWVSDFTPTAAEVRKRLAERTAEALRGAMRGGVLPGGGIALYSCKAKLLQKYKNAKDADERMAYYILSKAVEAPLRTLLANAGIESPGVIHQLSQAGPGFGYDIWQGRVINLVEAGILDAASVVREGAYRAIFGAALALTVDTIIHRSIPPQELLNT